MTKLSAPYALKKYIIEYANKQGYSGYGFSGPLNTETEINEAFADMHDQIGFDAQQDIMEGEYKTNLEHDEFARHCECDSVAVLDYQGNFIGFPNFHSGGKHFDASEYYDYSIKNAYFLSCEEKEVLTIQRTWRKVDA